MTLAVVAAAAATDGPLQRVAAAVWSGRVVFEHHAVQRFARLADAMRCHGVAPQLCSLALEAARDEARHAELCSRLTLSFGGCIPRDEGRAAPEAAPRELKSQDRLLYEVVALSCVMETVSTAALGVLRERAREPGVRSVIHQILRDEVGHSRLGWAYLASEPSPDARALVAEYLPEMLAATAGVELLAAPPAPSSNESALESLGVLSYAGRRSVFVASVRDVVLPGLGHFGVDTAAAERWLSSVAA